MSHQAERREVVTFARDGGQGQDPFEMRWDHERARDPKELERREDVGRFEAVTDDDRPAGLQHSKREAVGCGMA